MRQRVSRRDFLFGRLRMRMSGSTEVVTPAPAPAPEAVVVQEAPPPPPTRAQRRRAALAALPQHRQTMVARVDRHRCLGSIGQVCTVCMERCPEPDVITLTGTEPVIDIERCTGCGECERRCPAPFPAVRVLPLLGGSR